MWNDKAATGTLTGQIMDAARDAGRIIRSAHPGKEQVMTKEGKSNFVTAYDDAVQEKLIGLLQEILPEAHFVGEEEGKEDFLSGYAKGDTFVIDPIDGTLNFMRHYEVSTTSIALLRDGEPYIGVIYDPFSDQMFWAEKGKGAYENGERLYTSNDDLEASLVNMGTAPYYEERVTQMAFSLGHYYLRRSLDIRRSGSAAYDLCLVASGRTGLFFEPVLSLWDYAAGALIVHEAGGLVTDLYGKPLSYRGKTSVCAVTKGVAGQDYLPPASLLEPEPYLLSR